MKFYHISLMPLVDARSILLPYTPFEHALYQGKTYTPIFTTLHAACRHRYPDLFSTILEQGHATAWLYEIHLSKADIAALVTPEVMTLDGLRHFDNTLAEMGKHHQDLELCCLTVAREAHYVGEVKLFESPEWGKEKGILHTPYPAVIDYYVSIDKMTEDKSGFVKKKTFSQVSTEIRHISRGYDELAILFRKLGRGDDVIPLVLQRGQLEALPDLISQHKKGVLPRRRFTPPCMTFVLSDKGDSLLRQYQVILNNVLVNYGFSPDQLYVIKSTGRFSRHVEDYYEREHFRRTCDYSSRLVSFVYRDSRVAESDKRLDSLKEAYELALLMLID